MLARFCLAIALATGAASAQELPRTADGRPDLQGIWQVRNRAAYNLQDHVARHEMPAGRGVVDGDEIPYQPWAAEQQRVNFADRATADPLAQCFLPGTPRIMYMEWPFQIFQTSEHVAITFEWSQVFRLIYASGTPQLHSGIESWMGHSRGRWEGDTLVVEVADHNDKTWFDAAGNFHSEELGSRNATRCATWTPSSTRSRSRIRKSSRGRGKSAWRCTARRMQIGSSNTNVRRRPRRPTARSSATSAPGTRRRRRPATCRLIRTRARTCEHSQRRATSRGSRTASPDLNGYFQSDGGGANYGLEQPADFSDAESRGIIVDPTDGKLPYQAGRAPERVDRALPHRGYEDPTAHCFVAGIPRSHYIPAPLHVVQTEDRVAVLFERMAWRHVALDGRAHLADHLRLWQGDSIGRWEGDTLVVETKNLNGKAWLNEVGDVLSHAATVVETFTPVSATQVMYRATVSDPIVSRGRGRSRCR